MGEQDFGFSFERSDLSDEELQELIGPTLEAVEDVIGNRY